MRAPGLQPAFRQRDDGFERRAEFLQQLGAGHGAPALRPADGHLLAISGMPVDQRLDADQPILASVLATTSRPEVSLSIRCTIPGRRSPPTPDRLSPQ